MKGLSRKIRWDERSSLFVYDRYNSIDFNPAMYYKLNIKKGGIFDMDGVIERPNTPSAFTLYLDELTQKYEYIARNFKAIKKVGEKISISVRPRKHVEKLIKFMHRARIKLNDHEDAAKEAVKRYQLAPGLLIFLSDLKNLDYKISIITGSPQELAWAVAKKIGIPLNFSFGTIYDFSSGRIGKQCIVRLGENKVKSKDKFLYSIKCKPYFMLDFLSEPFTPVFADEPFNNEYELGCSGGLSPMFWMGYGRAGEMALRHRTEGLRVIAERTGKSVEEVRYLIGRDGEVFLRSIAPGKIKIFCKDAREKDMSILTERVKRLEKARILLTAIDNPLLYRDLLHTVQEFKTKTEECINAVGAEFAKISEEWIDLKQKLFSMLGILFPRFSTSIDELDREFIVTKDVEEKKRNIKEQERIIEEFVAEYRFRKDDIEKFEKIVAEQIEHTYR